MSISLICIAQHEEIQLKLKTEIELEGFKKPFELKKGIDYMVLTPIDMKDLDKSKYVINNSDTVYDKSLNSKVVTITITVFNVEFKNSNSFYLNDVPAKISYTIPDKTFENKTFFGLDIFSSAYDSVRIDSSSNLKFPYTIYLNDLKGRKNATLVPNTIPFPTTNNSPNINAKNANTSFLKFTNVKIVRIIPCNFDNSTTYNKSELLKILSKISNISVEEETEIPPPQKAVDNVDYGITIRYFELNTASDSELLKNEIGNSISTSVKTFDMSTMYSSPPIIDYIEIWIK